MALTHVTAVRNTLADAIDTAVNTGATDPGGDMVLTTASSPTIVAIIVLQDPAFGAASGGTITLNGTPSITALNDGVVNGFTLRDRANSNVLSGTATGTGGGGDIELDNTNVTGGQTVQISSLTYSASA